MKHNFKVGLAITLLSLAILLFPLTSAFANTYLGDKTMHLYKGEMGEYCVYLQNTGDEDILQVIKIFEGEEYIKNLDDVIEEFSVPIGTVSDDLPVCMEVKLSKDSEKGEKYAIGYGVTSPPSDDEKGMVSLAPVQIREKFYITERLDKKPISPMPYVIIGILLVAGLVLIYIKYRRAKQWMQ